MNKLKDLMEFMGRIEVHLTLCGPDGYNSRNKDVVKYTRSVSKAIKKEQGLKSYLEVSNLNDETELGEEAEKCFGEFKAWWEANQPSWDLLDDDGPIHDHYLFSKVQEEGWELPYASHGEFRNAVESVTRGLTEQQQQHFRNIVGVVFALGRFCAP